MKILETLYIPVGAYEFEEYLHGVANTINEQSYLIHLINDGKNRERMLALCAFSAEHHGHDAVISAGTPTGVEGELNLQCSGNELTLPFEMLLPFHAISAILSEKRGVDCDKPLFPDFIQRLHTKA